MTLGQILLRFCCSQLFEFVVANISPNKIPHGRINKLNNINHLPSRLGEYLLKALATRHHHKTPPCHHQGP